MIDTKPAADELTGGIFSLLLFAFGLSVFVTFLSIYKLGRMLGVAARGEPWRE